jgi:energy-coupling factor transporter ATP-binding protein EcfA2
VQADHVPVTGSSPAGSVVARTRILTRSPTHPTSKEAALTPQSTPAVETSGLVKRFRTTRAVDRVDLQMPIGSVYGLLGPNGAGKTTVIRMLVGLIRPDSGSIYVNGQPVHAGADVLSAVGALIEGPGFLPHLTGEHLGEDAQVAALRGLHPLGDGEDVHARLEQRRELAAGPAHPERVDPAHDDIGPIERLLGLLELEGSGRPGDLEVEARMHPRLLDAVDDFTVEVRADQAHLVAVVRERKSEGRGHYARAKNTNGRHASSERRNEPATRVPSVLACEAAARPQKPSGANSSSTHSSRMPASKARSRTV